jgi:hypothetical protein
MPGFIENLGPFTEALGVENAPTIIHLASVPWPTAENRNQFIYELTGYSVEDTNA